MSKRAKKRSQSQELPASRQRTLRLARVVRRNLMAFVIGEGMKALDEVLEQDRAELCGAVHYTHPIADETKFLTDLRLSPIATTWEAIFATNQVVLPKLGARA